MRAAPVGEVVNLREREAIEAEAWQWLIRLDGDEPLSQVQLDALLYLCPLMPEQIARIDALVQGTALDLTALPIRQS